MTVPSTNVLYIVLYANDMQLIVLPLTELQSLFKMCELELKWLDSYINTHKSRCMRIGNRFDSYCAQITSIDGISLPCFTELRCLGVYILSSRKFKCSIYTTRSGGFVVQPMPYLAMVRVAVEEVVLQLIDS